MAYNNARYTKKTRKLLEAPDTLVFTPMHGAIRAFGSMFLLTGLLAVGFCVADLLGYIHGQGDAGGALVVAGIFVLAGYCVTFYVARLEFDLLRRHWQHWKGIPPFVKHCQGSLNDWNHVHFSREQRTRSHESGSTVYAAWAVALHASASSSALAPLPVFEFPCQIATRQEVSALAQLLADKLGLPLRDAGAEN